MNDKLLLRKKVKFKNEYLKFMSFIHPEFEYVSDIDTYENPLPAGIVYTGEYSDSLISRLDTFTPNWIIINDHHFDVDLSTNEGLIKYLLPINYSQIKNSSKQDELSVYTNMSYGQLLEKIKVCLIDNSKLEADIEAENSVYNLFESITRLPDCLNKQFFLTVNKQNVKAVTSAILTFLMLVKTNNIKNKKPGYAKLISQSHFMYGNRIKPAINRYIKSKANREISLYNLLTDLNKAR